MNNNIIYLISAILIIVLLISLYLFFNLKKSDTITKSETTFSPANKEVKPETKDSSPEPVEEIKKPIQEKEEKKRIEKVRKIVVKPDISDPIPEPLTKLNINISTKTEKLLIKKLETFEKNKGFLKKDVTLNSLSKQFDTNTKYLSEIIKSYKNKNFNQYLNELRINYLIDQLNTNEKVLNTKVSYLASDFGFSSHSSFSTLFTQFIGQSPSEYIKQIKEQKKQS